MSTDLAIRQPHEAERLSTDQLKYLASTSFVPKDYRGKIPEILACVATGRELGLGDLESLRMIYVVDGKPTLSAEVMTKLARRNGHSIQAEYGEGRVTVHGKRADNGDEMTVTWTMSMAKRAGLDGKQNWTKYPESMLWARAVSQLCRMLFPDVLGGVSHTPDEVELTAEGRIEEATDVGPVDVETFEEVDEQEPPSFDESSGAAAAASPAANEAGASAASELFPVPPPDVHEKARRNRKKETGTE